MKGPGSLLCARQHGHDAGGSLHPSASSLAGTHSRNICLYVAPPPCSPLPFFSHYLSVNSTLREPKCWEEKNSIMFVLAFQLCEAFVPFFPLDLAPDFLEVAETGGLGCISRRSNVGDRWTDISRAPSVLPVPSCPGSHSRLAGLEWRAPASWPPNPQLLLWQTGIPLFCPEGGQQ